ncbi:hypothetical protein PYJP_17050 [Pyrofollis japonicus]|uniref:glycosyltransferase family 2 protein n=1 Tax=Pyrofollis japonicus TaxID=3060460 RepID=UPI00295B1854|nr:glycosyltransferase family 2 protein [Pyrofollis japonicus]BEP18353.1 hypothetical protein PYJP_17050 [Pyrofollis japonicus]
MQSSEKLYKLSRLVTVIIPVKNEEDAIGLVIDELLKVGVPRDKIIVIDGHSTDNTREIASSKGVMVVEQDGNGKADAVRKGISLTKTQYILVIDGDYTYPAHYIWEMLRLALEKDCGEVIGARLSGRNNIPLLNRFGNWFLTKTFNLLFGTRLQDVLSGMYLVKRDLLDYALFETKGFSIEAEIAAHVAGSGEEICEYPITYRKRIGEKKLKVTHGLQIFLDMIRLSWSYNPIFLIALIGALLLVPGIVLGVWTSYEYFAKSIKHYIKGIVAIILTAVGAQSLLLSIFAVYAKRAELRLLRAIRKLQHRLETR